MRLLFVHRGFPGQYLHLARHFAAHGSNEVVGIGEVERLARHRDTVPGARLAPYNVPSLPSSLLTTEETAAVHAVRRGVEVGRVASKLRTSGFYPDVICAHISWGEGLFLKDIFPEAPLLLYCEFFRRPRGAELTFDPEFQNVTQANSWIRIVNGPVLSALDAADWGITPTRWQHEQFPAVYQPYISIVHDGIDTDIAAPNPKAHFTLPGTSLTLSTADEVVTFVARDLEPYRGFHVFMRSIPEIQKRRPNARIVIVGGDDVSYTLVRPEGQTYRQQLLSELGGRINPSRVHFTGQIPYSQYLSLLQISSAHVYLTYPFVLSWSMLEALSAGCVVVGSRTPPVEEIIADGVNGFLVDFFSSEKIAAKVAQILQHKHELQPIRERARQSIRERYDLKAVCLPEQLKVIEGILSRR